VGRFENRDTIQVISMIHAFTITQNNVSGKTKTLMPNNDISGCTLWLTSNESLNNHYLLVDDIPSQIDYNTFIYWESEDITKELYAFQNFTESNVESIESVELIIEACCYPDRPTTNEVFYGICSPDSTCIGTYDSTIINLTETWASYSKFWYTDPSTSSPWTNTTISDSAFGVKGAGQILPIELADSAPTDDCISIAVSELATDEADTLVAYGSGAHLLLGGFNHNTETFTAVFRSISVGAAIRSIALQRIGTDNYWYIYIAGDNSGLFLYTYDGDTNTLSFIDSHDAGGTYLDVASGPQVTGNTYMIYTINGNAVLAYETDGTSLVLRDTDATGGFTFYSVCADKYDKRYFYTLDYNGVNAAALRAFYYNPATTTISHLAYTSYIGAYYRIRTLTSSTYKTLIAGAYWTSGLRVTQFNKSDNTFTHIDTHDAGGSYQYLSCNYPYIYVTSNTDSWLRIYTLLNNNLSLIETVSLGDNAYWNVVADNYLYIANDDDGILIYREPVTQTIRVANMYLKVHYTSTLDTCYLPNPQIISKSHSRNTKIINFWNGQREVYDLARTNKTMVLQGMLWDDASLPTDTCSTLQCVRTMAKRQLHVTLDSLGLSSYNGDYYIRSLGWKVISTKPAVYEWMLELEDAEL